MSNEKTFKEVADEWFEYSNYGAPSSGFQSTKQCFYEYLIPLWGDKLISEINKRDIIDMLWHNEVTTTGHVYCGIKNIVVGVCSFAVDRKYITKNTFDGISNKELPTSKTTSHTD